MDSSDVARAMSDQSAAPSAAEAGAGHWRNGRRDEQPSSGDVAAGASAAPVLVWRVGVRKGGTGARRKCLCGGWGWGNGGKAGRMRGTSVCLESGDEERWDGCAAHRQQHVRGMQQHVSGMQQHVSGMQQHVSGMQQHVSGMQQHVRGMQQHVSGMQQH
eukprot:350891-Chlamydomonas_euryale.AAC.16